MKTKPSATLRALWIGLLLLCGSLPLRAEQFGLFTYEVVNGSTVTITHYPTFAWGMVEIPGEIAGKPVTSIGGAAFWRCTGLTSVTIPSSVTSIGDYAFLGCKAIGYEIDERLVQQSREALANENLGTLASIEHKDICTLDLSGADVVTVFLYPRLMERLIPQLEKLKLGSRIVSHQFEMPGIKPDKTILVESKEDGDQHRIFMWTTPLKKNPAP